MIDGRLYKADAYGTGDHLLSFECINLQKGAPLSRLNIAYLSNFDKNISNQY